MQIFPRHMLRHFQPPECQNSYFFSFEGIEGAGKSTQIKKLSQYLENLGLKVIVLREPGGTPFGEKLRQAILEAQGRIHPLAEAHLFASSRAQLLQDVILKELSIPQTVVICDRYMDSSLAYQGKARGLGVDTILNLHDHYPLTIVPHLTFYIKIALQTSLERQRKRNANKDYFEAENEEFYQKLIQGYEEVCTLFPERVVIINGEAQEEQIFTEITGHVAAFLGV
jgi:dTMP kinase